MYLRARNNKPEYSAEITKKTTKCLTPYNDKYIFNLYYLT